MSYVKLFCEKYCFEADATSYLENSFIQLRDNSIAYSIFESQIHLYEKNIQFDHAPVFATLDSLQETTGIHRYTLHLLYLICLTRHLKVIYDKENLPTEVFTDSVSDLKWKARECKNVYGIWGIFVSWWTIGFFKLKLFALGRLQFELSSFPFTIELENKTIHAGEPYINVHIPSCSPLDYQECLTSYALAATFFSQHYSLDRIIFGCKSWLLLPDLCSVLPKTSRILAFMSDYTILSVEEDTKYRNLFRIFNVRKLPENIDELPSETSLQRALKNWLKSGHLINNAFGIFFYE